MGATKHEAHGAAQPREERRLSARRLAANRQNARKSTGPRSERGKAVASQNARTHGLLSSCVVVDWSGFEDPENFRILRESLLKDLRPEGALEELHVEKIAVGFWRLQRMWGLERHQIVRGLYIGIGELATKESTDWARRENLFLRMSLLVSHARAGVGALRESIAILMHGLSGKAGIGDAVAAAIQELDHAPNWAEFRRKLRWILPQDEELASESEGEVQAREFAGLRNLLESSLSAYVQRELSEKDLVRRLEQVHHEMVAQLKASAEALSLFERVLGMAEERLKDKRPLYGEEEGADFLGSYLGPPLDGLDVYVRYETSVERRLQKDIEFLYTLQAIRLGRARKLLGRGAVGS